MQGKGADEGETVYVAEMHFAGKEQEGAEEEEEEDGARQVGVVHYVLGDGMERVQYCECLSKQQRHQSAFPVFDIRCPE